MPDLASNVTWQEIVRETQAGNIPHCRAIVAPGNFHDEIIAELSNLILGSYRPNHPDLLIIGSVDKPAPIGNPDTMTEEEYRNSTRGLIENIALKPLEAQRRLGVIMSADKLNKSAANSLLKLAEEPPSHAYLLFLMEDIRFFLPTLRSRSHVSVIFSQDEEESYSIPVSETEWLEWLSRTRKANDLEMILSDLAAWRNFAASSQNFILASKLGRLYIIANKKNLSVPFMCDVIILALKGENKNFENIFDDLW
ncbi:MAG: hypothetical protein IJS40_02835 [Synergistaceae bacterium]|nr:hypothetical protein [Synergistaceae bacterium]